GWLFFSSRRRHTRLVSDWSSDVCSSDLLAEAQRMDRHLVVAHGLLGLEALLGVDALEPLDPRAIAPLVELALRLGRQLREDRAEIGRASCRERGESAGEADCLSAQSRRC